MKAMCLVGISALALVANAAQAQVAPPVQTGSPASQSSSSDTTDAGTIQDIIVTAQKSETTIQKTPNAITSIGGGELVRAGVTNTQELSKLVPGLQIEQNSSQSSIFIRGVGSRTLASTADPAVAFSVDGVYYARAAGPDATLFDVTRLEVVKGPQGTLYGRNATGGALNVITNHPVLGQRSLDVTLEGGNYDFVHTVAAINLPLGDDLALRIAAQNVYHDGYLSDGESDADTKAARVSLLYKPSPDLSLYASVDYAHLGGAGPGTVPMGPGGNNNALTTRFVVPGDPYVGQADPRVNAFLHNAVAVTALPIPVPGVKCVGMALGPVGAPGTPAIPFCSYPLGAQDVVANAHLNNQYFGGNLTLVAGLGFADLTAIGGYRGVRIDDYSYPDWKPQQQNVRSDEYTAELRLASRPDAGRLKWLLGGFYLREDIGSVFDISAGNQGIPNPAPAPGSPLAPTTCFAPLAPPLCIVNVTVIKNRFVVSDYLSNESYAAFGQATYSLADWLRLTGGIRYTHDTKNETSGGIASYYLVPAGVSDFTPSQGRASFNNTSYRAGIEADVAPRSLLYATYSTGYHAGGFNQGVAQGPNTYVYQPEHVKSYVVGSKNRFFDNHLQVNVEGFWVDYDNYQTQSLGAINDGSTACASFGVCPLTLRTDNAASARSRGIETDIVWSVVRNGTFDANVLYNEAKFLRFISPLFPTGSVDYSGRTLTGAPRWTVTAGYTQNVPLANGGRVVANVSSQYRSGVFMFYDDAPGSYQKSYTRTDLTLTYEVPGGRLSVTGYVRNVENHATLTQATPVEQATGIPYNTLNPPRTYGAILSFHF